MSVPARRRFVTDVDVGGGFKLVKRAMDEPEYVAMGRRARPDWHPAIYVALQLWERTPRPGSRVRPEWMPLSVLLDLFAEYGIDDADAVIATIWKCEQMHGTLVQRSMEIDGVVHPAVKYVGSPMADLPATLPGLPLSPDHQLRRAEVAPMKKLSKSDLPQARHGDPVPAAPPERGVCRCDIPQPGHQSDRCRYTGIIGRSTTGRLFAVLDCPHGKTWTRYEPRRAA